MANPRQYLDWHGQQWRVRVKVPPKLRDLIGRDYLKHSLGTSDLKLANERKWPVVARLKGAIDAARKARATNDPLDAEALRLRLYKDDEGTTYAAHDRAAEIESEHGYTRAKSFFDVATGQATPLDHYADAFVTHKAYPLKSAGDFRRALGWLRAWLQENDVPLVERVTRKAAARFIAEDLCAGRSRTKAGAYLGFLRQYWKWMQEAGHFTEENPWAGQSLPSSPRVARNAEADSGKRPYTNDELATLLYGPADGTLHDLIRLSALSGMRLEEICQLTVADCEGGFFRIRQGKTENARRRVPIHRSLAGIVKRRTEGKRNGDYLVEELPPVPPSREGRSDPAGKRFGRYRKALGIDERPNGKAKSNVEFHSFRRWFIAQARDALARGRAKFTPWTLADVVGHDDNDIKKILHLTMSHYPGPSGEDAMRACVASVRLPTPKTKETDACATRPSGPRPTSRPHKAASKR